ncbi:MAG: PQQ-dependent sugar dehydrogenase [Bacteroidetes bacterium]|nr:PQQ-dependent sugar dehydrogenase [Bacteroidota bacterium]
MCTSFETPGNTGFQGQIEKSIHPNITVSLNLIASGLQSPVGMATANDGTNRLFVMEQSGQIRIIKNGVILEKPFLDISQKLDNLSIGYSEKGLLGLAFHPNYKTNGRFFIYYSAPSSINESNHKSVIAEYSVSANANVAQTTERIILEIEQPESNHNGGTLVFGKDGLLYIASGDGGGGGDQHGALGNGQNLQTLLGKILRINIDGKAPYAIPTDNPFINQNARKEIYAYGLRNPWRISFDRVTGKLFAGDVGQNKFEEIDIIEKGKNYGWRIMEGDHCYDANECDRVGLTYPIYEYPHSVGISVCGGYVYRGSYKALQGMYVYGDYNGKLFLLQQQQNEWQSYNLMITSKSTNDIEHKLNSFGEDEQGELYVLAQRGPGPRNNGGKIFKLVFSKK